MRRTLFDDQLPPPAPAEPIFTTYFPADGVVRMVKRICQDYAINVPWRDLDRDIGNVLRDTGKPDEARTHFERSLAMNLASAIKEPSLARSGTHCAPELVVRGSCAAIQPLGAGR